MISDGKLIELTDIFVSMVAQPTLDKLTQEMGESAGLIIVVIQDRQVVHRVEYPPANTDSTALAECRVRFSEGLRRSMFPFKSQMIVTEFAVGTGFSGTSIKGILDLSEDDARLEVTGRSNRYNVWKWEREFSMT